MYYLLLINALSFLLMLADKEKAKRHLWRIPEVVLMAAAALGGSAGILAGMYLLRHKTRKPLFYLGVPVILVIHIILRLECSL